jgi:hypothetical protein
MAEFVKKGDVIVLCQKHSYTTSKMKTISYTSYRLGYATKINVKGLVIQYKPIDAEKAVNVDVGTRIGTILDDHMQEGAQRLANLTKGMVKVWDSTDKVREAVLYAFNFNRLAI